jgi:DNA-binding CsgD family transcriptional regulator
MWSVPWRDATGRPDNEAVNGFTSDTAIMVFGDDLGIVCWNDGAEKLTGIPATEAAGRPCWQVIAGPLFVHVIHDAPAVATGERAAQEGPPPQLTPRQREILALLAEGNAVKTVAAKLGLMETTVRNHVRLLLVAHSQLEAVARARGFGLLS